jgi:hypothetical protein
MEEYRQALLGMDEGDFLLKEDSKPNIAAKVKLGIYQLQRLFAQLSSWSIRPTIAPKLFKNLALPDNFKGRLG